MPRAKPALRERRRAADSPDAVLKRVVHLAFDMEEPLNAAADFVRALRLIGDGLMLHDDTDGRAIAATAWAASDRLDALRAAWKGVLQAARKRKVAPRRKH
jgi:hypothetical protein